LRPAPSANPARDSSPGRGRISSSADGSTTAAVLNDHMTIAYVAFDAPLRHSFSYRVPDGWNLPPGQRARAPLRGAARVGMVVAVRDGAGEGLKPLARLVDAAPVLSPAQLELVDWIAAQSLSSVGSTCAALLPPPAGEDPGGVAPRPATGADRPGSPKPELLIGAGREKRVLER